MKKLFTRNNADVIIAITAITDTFPAKLKTDHVYAHANSKPEDLSLPEFLNAKADEIAQNWLTKQQKAGKQKWPDKLIPLEACNVYLFDGEKLATCQEFKQIYNRIANKRRIAYNMERFGWTETVERSIDMASFAQSTHKLDEATAKFIHKLTSRKLITAKHLMQRGKGEVNCIKCGDEETFDHVFQCSSKEKW
jgi:hypothetical protein